MKISTLAIWVLKIDTVGDLMIGSNRHKYKKRIMKECGIKVVDSPAHIGQAMAELLSVNA